MTESKEITRLYDQFGAQKVLEIFGLDKVISTTDDPELWAAAIQKHWSAPNEPGALPESLRFGIGKKAFSKDGATEEVLATQSGMEQVETWCFKRMSETQLEVTDCPAASLSFMSMLITGSTSAIDSGVVSLTKEYLDVERPSCGKSKVLVHAGFSAPPSAGSGETRYWIKNADGKWVESEETYSRWIT